MKRTLSILLVLCFCFLWGCENDKSQPTSTTPETSQTPLGSTGETLPETTGDTQPETTEATEPETTEATQPATTEATTPATEPTKPATEPAKPTTEPTQPATQPTQPATQPTTPSKPAGKIQNMKAMWISQFDLAKVYLNGSTQRSQSDFTTRMGQILDNVKSQSFNTVFLQIRPYADSMYPSQVYPTSAHVAGQTGGKLQYDPVAIVVSLARQKGLSIHAWINPLRAMTDTEIKLVSTDYAIGRWYNDPQYNGKYIVKVGSRWYLNPAYEEVRQLICDGAEEALRLYDFDGLHIDDYFYPTTDAGFDSEAYTAYKANGGKLSLANYRRDNVNQVVKGLYQLTHRSGSGKLFGISPGGNIDNTYGSLYADVYTWCGKSGYVDYICPQVYWGLEHQTCAFDKVCRQWTNLIKVDSVTLIIGMTLDKAYSLEDKWAGSGKDEWKNHKDILLRCLQVTQNLDKCQGVSVFCYQYFFDPVTGQSVSQTAQERENFMSLFRTITWS